MLDLFVKKWLPLVLTLIILISVVFYVFPSVRLVTNDMNLLTYQNGDQGVICKNYMGFYNHYFSGTNMVPKGDAGYPTFFYYLAGLVFFPIALISGLQLSVLLFGLRFLNLVIGISTILLCYFIVLKLYRNHWLSFLTSLLLLSTTQIIYWWADIRPHPLELFMTLLSVFFIFQSIDKYSFKRIVLATIFAGLAFGTKFGGFLLLPFIAYIYFLNESTIGSYSVFKKTRRLIFLLVGYCLIVAGIAFLLLSTWFIAFYKTKMWGVSYLQHFGFPHVFFQREIISAVVFSSIIIIAGCSVLVLLSLLKKAFQTGRAQLEKKLLLFFDLFFSFTKLAVIFIATFLIVNPHFIFHPYLSILEHGRQTKVEFIGPKGLFSLFWISHLYSKYLLGICLSSVLMFCCLLIVKFRKLLYQNNDKLEKKHLLLIAYSILYLLFLIGVIKFPAHHYELIIVVISCILIPYIFVIIQKLIFSSVVKNILHVVILLLLVLSFHERLPKLIEEHNSQYARFDKKHDIAWEYGLWMSQNISKTSQIFTSDNRIYVPIEFSQVISSCNIQAIDLTTKNVVFFVVSNSDKQFIVLPDRNMKKIYEIEGYTVSDNINGKDIRKISIFKGEKK